LERTLVEGAKIEKNRSKSFEKLAQREVILYLGVTLCVKYLLQVPLTQFLYKKKWSYFCNRPWGPTELWDVEVPTFTRQSAHRWRWGCQSYAPAALYTGKILITHFFRAWVDPRAIVRLEAPGQLKISIIWSANEPATFRLVAQFLNQLRYRMLLTILKTNKLILFYFKTSFGHLWPLSGKLSKTQHHPQQDLLHEKTNATLKTSIRSRKWWPRSTVFQQQYLLPKS
jgi:hypothetical protein